MQQELMLMYRGFCGQVHLPLQTSTRREEEIGPARPVLARQKQGDWMIQYLYLSSQEEPSLHSQSAEQASVLLAGMFFCSGPFSCFVSSLAEALIEGRYAALPPGEYCGCLVSQASVWFFQTRASNERLFYTRDQGCLRWSTDPRQLASIANLDEEALAWCCTGKDTFVYRDIESVAAGTVVQVTANSVQRSVFEQVVPLDLPRHITLQDLAECCSEALREATRPLASTQHKIGVLLSGGIDSSAIAATLAHHGADSIAYHIHVPGVASELADAQAVCQMLGLPLVVIEGSNGSDYLSERWRFSHPYNHAGLRWFEQVADQASRDGVTLMITGRGADPSFGPQHSYGLCDVFSAPIAWREKLAMMSGALSTDWLLPDLIKSIGRSSSLINESSLAPATVTRHALKIPPFFRPRALHPFPAPDLYDVTSFSPQDLALESTIWQPRGIRVTHPYHHVAVQRLVASLPAVYRLLPYRGKKVVKPVLRWAFATDLPPRAVRQRRGPWLSVPHQDYCLRETPYLARLIGSPTSQVVQREIVDPIQLHRVLENHEALRAQYKAVIATAMTELYLRQFDDEKQHVF